MFKSEDSKIVMAMALGAAIGIGASCLVHAAKRGHWLCHIQQFAEQMRSSMIQANDKCCTSQTAEPQKTTTTE